MEKMNLLQNTPIFLKMSEQDICDALSFLDAELVEIKKGKAIVTQGQSVVKAGIFICGTAHVVMDGFDGEREIVSEISAGEMFGEALCCSEREDFPVGIYAEENCTVLMLDIKKLLEAPGKENGRLLSNLFSIISAKTLKLRGKISIMSKKKTRDKIMAYLFMQSKREKKSEFYIPFDRQQLADYLGVDRSAMSAEIGVLVREGKIETEKNHFVLK